MQFSVRRIGNAGVHSMVITPKEGPFPEDLRCTIAEVEGIAWVARRHASRSVTVLLGNKHQQPEAARPVVRRVIDAMEGHEVTLDNHPVENFDRWFNGEVVQ